MKKNSLFRGGKWSKTLYLYWARNALQSEKGGGESPKSFTQICRISAVCWGGKKRARYCERQGGERKKEGGASLWALKGKSSPHAMASVTKGGKSPMYDGRNRF